MVQCGLVRKQKISRRTSHELIQMMAKDGDHHFAFTTDASVKKFFTLNGYDYDKLVEEVRKYPQPIPLVENILPATGFASPGLQVWREDRYGNQDLHFEGPGAFTMFGYQAQFEQAIENIESAVKESSPQHLLTACMNGVAAIEGYVNFKAEEWNKEHPENPLRDTREAPVRFEDKIDKWLPVMTFGRMLDKGRKNWNDFKKLKGVRDNIAVHPKSSGHAFSLKELADLINCFATGIAGLLVELHRLFGERIPSRMIRYMYAPEVEIVDV